MFTGLVEQIGRVQRADRHDKGATLDIECSMAPYTLGESIAVHGVCLTVAEILPDGFMAYASEETLRCSVLGELEVGSRVHLERALALGERLGGHLVSGHVDGIGSRGATFTEGDCTQIRFNVPKQLRPFFAPKGSVTLNGVSLTVNDVGAEDFSVMLVPHTLEHTTLGELDEGQNINIEVDILAKYVASLMGKEGVDGALGGGSFSP